MDIIKPKAKSLAGQPFEVETRPIMAHDAGSSSAENTSVNDMEDATKTPTPTVEKIKHTVITPIHSSEELSTETAPSAPPQNVAAEEPSVASPATAQKKQETSAASVSDDTSSIETESTDTAAQPTAETRKAVAEAEEAAKRDTELQEYINSHKFFVPINAVARKHSIEISIILTLVVVVLAVLLIDLMLDSGIVLLLQKIPHTHFFTT